MQVLWTRSCELKKLMLTGKNEHSAFRPTKKSLWLSSSKKSAQLIDNEETKALTYVAMNATMM